MMTGPKTNKAKYVLLSQICSTQLDDLLTHLGIEHTYAGYYYRGGCPVHQGNNRTAWNIFPEGSYDYVYARWICYSRGCQARWGGNIFGLIRGVLSNQYGYEVSFKESLDYLCDFLGVDFDELEVNEALLDKIEFSRQSRLFDAQAVTNNNNDGLPRILVQKHLAIPSKYYLGRGYPANLLHKYDIGDCRRSGRTFSDRSVVPVYDDNYRVAIGFTGRSQFSECPRCGEFHNPADKCEQFSKWYHNFNASEHLFNFWFAKKYIRESRLVVVCEGPGDVLRLEAAGIHNAVGLFGNDMSDAQSLILERSGAMSVILMLDQDQAGQSGMDVLRRRLSTLYRVFVPTWQGKDVGELSEHEVTRDIQPYLEKIAHI